MKKWGLGLMLFAMLAVPMLACGFPLPAGTTMMAVSKAVCADGEDAATCQLRQDAFQMMGKLETVRIDDMQVALLVDTGNPDELTSMTAEGSFEYQVTTAETGLGANLRADLTGGEVVSADGTQPLGGNQFVVVGDKGYTSEDNGQTWTYEELDSDALLGIGMMLGLPGTTGSGLDLYANPAIFSVTTGEDVEIDGQTMHVQTLTFNLEKLLSTPEAITAMMEDSAGPLAEIGVSMDDLGDPAQVAMFAAILLPAFEGSAFSTTLYIGAEDGYIHRIEESHVFKMDSTKIAFGSEGEEPTVMTMTYELSGTFAQFNNPLAIEAPQDATEGEGLLSGEGGLLSGGLGGSLFGQ